MSNPIDLGAEMMLLTLQLYNNPVIPRNVVQLVVDTIIHFVNVTYTNLILQKIEYLSQKYNSSVVCDMRMILESSSIILSEFQTEHKRFSYYQQNDLMIMPVEYSVGSITKNAEFGTEKNLEVKSYATYIPLTWSLKLLLEIPGTFDLIINYMNNLKLENDIIKNVIQGDVWKEKTKSFGDKLVLPIFIFQDEWESGNALGSNAGKQKFGSVYASLPCFPPQYALQLENILLVGLFQTSHRKQFGNLKIFAKLISELNDLRKDGLLVRVNGKEHKVYFILSLILGDNLGLNEMLGFIDTFNSSKPCRLCKATIPEIKTLVTENIDLIRTLESYDADCESKNPVETGIKEKCVFHLVEDYHVCENVTLDIMHDIFEGTANYTMVHICHDLIFKQKLFTLKFLNNRLETFEYGYIQNKVPIIKKEHIQTKNKLKMSASEMISFTRYFGLLVGDKIEENNETWALYVLFRKIISIITSPRIMSGHVTALDEIVPSFLSLYKKMYGDLTFKFHNMTHLVRALKKNGPLVHYWGMKFESKHRQLKLTAVSTSSRKNLLWTLSIKNQLRLAYERLTKNIQRDKVKFEHFKNLDEDNKIKYFPCTADEEVIRTRHAQLDGINYAIDMIIVTDMQGNDDLPIFGRIKDIFITQNKLYLLMELFESVYFDDHCYAYNVEKCTSEFILKDAKLLPDEHQCLLVKYQGSLYVATKYIL